MLERKGCYEYRAVRYRATADKLFEQGLNNNDTICDIGAGWTEFDYCLRKEYDWRGRYLPIDAGMTKTDLNNWEPDRNYDYFVTLEILEHLYEPEKFLTTILKKVNKGVVISVPNPETTDVFSMDETHVSLPDKQLFQKNGFIVEETEFFGGFYSQNKPGSLFAYYFK